MIDASQFSRLKSTYGDALTEEMTVLEFWQKFGYAPEDRYSYHQKITDNQGVLQMQLINLNRRHLNFLTPSFIIKKMEQNML